MKYVLVLKKTAAIILVVCIFLPLSTCTKHASEKLPGHETETVEIYVMPDKEIGIKRFLPAFVFCLPAILLLIGTGKENNLVLEIFNILASLGIIAVLVVHEFLGSLAIGGYLSAVAVSSYLLATISHIVLIFKGR